MPLIGSWHTGRVWKHHFTMLSHSTNSVHRFVNEHNNYRVICKMLNFSSLSLVHCFVNPNGLSLVSRQAEVKGRDGGEQRSRRTWLTRRQVGSCVDHQTGGDTWRCWCVRAAGTQLCSFIHSFIQLSNGFQWIRTTLESCWLSGPNLWGKQGGWDMVVLVSFTHKHILTVK